ncbi:GMC family oxidoreductase [Jatrophihabitans telluris]|uniref:GMC family oxidoreductase n=1 Tax=Jatrophihabitans telluris TaxID=2038343 RepID=A0ABY4R0R3_9ACTN|nr:GMC family oxidoreductase [Jatrophihabitans telluris]UQX89486.1 GMC family oxidoreductase [Jatrophihabitans telluris]
METVSAEVVVVGSGMGGGTVARALAERGVDVLILERGERLPREPENWFPREVFVHKRYKPKESWRDLHGNSFGPGVHYVVGGNTKVYGASLPRLRVSDFEEVQHLEGRSPAWPFSYADLEQHYAAAERMYRVHGTTGEDPTEPWRSAPYPYPAVPHDPYVAALAQRLRDVGVRPSSTSMGIDLREGGSCLRCRTCDGFPCRVGAKSDAETCGIDPALATGHARLATGLRVRRLESTSKRVVAALADGPEGPVRVLGRRFVLSAGSVNSAALLLASGSAEHPDGLANSSGYVGRNFMMHNNAHIAAVDLDQPNHAIFQKTLAVTDWYEDGGDGHPLGSLQLLGKVQGVMMKSWATKVPLAVLDQLAHRSVEWLVMAEDLPDPRNRVTLDADGTIRTSRVARGMKQHAILHRRARRMLREAGYNFVATQPFDISMNSHQCGTAVAGTDPTRSVLDPWCKAHDLDNLWVVDGSFFPSSGAMNPALTIAAQALRVVAESDLAG